MSYPVTQPNKAKVLSQCYLQRNHLSPVNVNIYECAASQEGGYITCTHTLISTIQSISQSNLLHDLHALSIDFCVVWWSFPVIILALIACVGQNRDLREGHTGLSGGNQDQLLCLLSLPRVCLWAKNLPLNTPH